MAGTDIGNLVDRAGRVTGRTRQGFRRWRRGRPFWGGLFTILGGVEILLLPLLKFPLMVQVGIAGVSGLIAGVLMVVLGLAVWIAPHYRVFAGIAVILLSLMSFLTSNFGGFLLGMLLGLVGGSLACAWTPIRPRSTEPPTGQPEDPSVAVDGPDAAAAQPTMGEPTDPQESTDPKAPTGRPDQPASVGESPAQQQSSAGGGHPPLTLLGPVLLVLALLAPLLAALTSGPAELPRLAAAQAPTVNSAVPVMHADTVDMSALTFGGVVVVTTLQGPLRTLKFSMDRVVMHDYTLDAPGGPDGGDLGLSIGTLTLESDVDFYTTRMSGLLSGTIPVTFTPDAPPPLVPSTLSFTDFTSEQVFVRSDSLDAAGLGEVPGNT